MREDGRAARHRAETTTATIEDMARAIHGSSGG